MPHKMLRFVGLEQALPDKRPAIERREDFDEIYRAFAEQKAREQAARCSQCGVPFCQIHCPANNNIPDWLQLAADGRWQEAYEVSAATNAMPEVCGRICPQDRLCEGNCVIEKGFESVTIGAVEKHITDLAWEKGWVKPIVPRRERSQSVGIVGAGPAGLSAADRLRRHGYQVTIYDRYDRAGGLLIYGIPNFKLDKEVVARRAQRLADSGVDIRLGFEVGRDATLEELRTRHDAVLLATGTYKGRALKSPGVGLPNIVMALPYLIAANRRGLGDALPAEDVARFDARGKRVVVLGGGDTAMDCVRTAVRQGAVSVACLYRRDRVNMPGSAREVVHAEEEGVTFEWLAAPEGFLGDAAVTAVRAHSMRLGAPDASGRQAPEPMPGSSRSIPAELVIQALGFDAEDLPRHFKAPDLVTTGWGTLRVDHRTTMTSLDGVFAAGDVVRGASLVVWAIRDGQDSAAAIHRYLAAAQQPALAPEPPALATVS